MNGYYNMVIIGYLQKTIQQAIKKKISLAFLTT